MQHTKILGVLMACVMFAGTSALAVDSAVPISSTSHHQSYKSSWMSANKEPNKMWKSHWKHMDKDPKMWKSSWKLNKYQYKMWKYSWMLNKHQKATWKHNCTQGNNSTWMNNSTCNGNNSTWMNNSTWNNSKCNGNNSTWMNNSTWRHVNDPKTTYKNSWISYKKQKTDPKATWNADSTRYVKIQHHHHHHHHHTQLIE